MSKINELTKPLPDSEIEFRIGATSYPKGFQILAYKTARTDVRRLNDVFGLNWECNYFYDTKNNLCCTIRIYDTETKQWIERTNVGTESMSDGVKGSYSDAMKRAGFSWGIGVELYDFPFVWINTTESDWVNRKGKNYPKARVQGWTLSGDSILNENGKKVATVTRGGRSNPDSIDNGGQQSIEEGTPVEAIELAKTIVDDKVDKEEQTPSNENQQKAVPKKSSNSKQPITWLSDAEYKKLISLQPTSDNVAAIEATLLGYSSDSKKMKKIYREGLEKTKANMEDTIKFQNEQEGQKDLPF